MKLAISLSAIVPSGVYSAVRPIGMSTNKLNALLDLIAHIEPERADLHVTVLYSRNENKVEGQPEVQRRIHRADIREFVSLSLIHI